MSNDRRECIRRLRDTLIQVRHAMEEAEARVEECNDTIRQLEEPRVVPHHAFLGHAVSQPYDIQSGRDDTGLVIQPALLIPQGFGICRYDTEEFCQLHDSPQGLEEDAVIHFCPFSQCGAAEKALLNSQFEDLFQRFSSFVDQCQLPRQSTEIQIANTVRDWTSKYWILHGPHQKDPNSGKALFRDPKGASTDNVGDAELFHTEDDAKRVGDAAPETWQPRRLSDFFP